LLTAPSARQWFRRLLGVTLTYWLASQVGFLFADHGYLTPVWPPAAVACVAAVLYGPSSLLGVAAYIAWDYLHETPHLGEPFQHALVEPLALFAAAFTCWGIARALRFDGKLSTLPSVLTMAGIGLVWAFVYGAGDTFGYCVYIRSARCATYGWPAHWGQSMVGDVFAALICMPALLSWAHWIAARPARVAARARRPADERGRVPGVIRLTREMVGYLGVAVLFIALAWFATRTFGVPVHLIGFLALPLLVWSAMKFPPLFVHSSILLTGMVTITMQLTAPSAANADPVTHLASLFLFLLSVASLTLIVNVVVQQQRRLANELAFRAQQERVELMLQAATDAVVSMDQDGRLTFWNPAAERIFGRRPKDVMGRPAADLLPHPALVAAQARGEGIAGLAEAGDALFSGAITELASLDAQGEPLPLEVSFSAYRNERAWNATAFIRDARAHKRQEEALRIARDRAEDATRAKSLFLATMSHELRTPLSGVIGMLQLGLRESMSSQARSRISLGLANAESLLTIINDILDFSKIEAGKMVFEAVDFDVRELVHSLIDLLDTRAQEKGLSLLCHFDESVPPWLRGDPVRFRQILLNLIGNALKFTDVGRVDVYLRAAPRDDGRLDLAVDVVDTGTGISPEAQARLFRSFEQADLATTRKYGGTGLGLAITRSLVMGMEGELTLKSGLGDGSTFSFVLPMAEGEPVEAEDDEAMAPFDCRLRILCAEDGYTNRVIVQAFVQGLGHEVEFVENGLDCVRRCAEATFDVILMDGRMPVMDGLEAARHIRAGGLDDCFVLDPSTWMIALTANATSQDREACLRAGMDDFLAKPLDERLLGIALHRAVRALRDRGRELRPVVATGDAGVAVLDALFGDAGGAEDAFATTPSSVATSRASAPARAAAPAAPGVAVAAPAQTPGEMPLAVRLRAIFATETPRLMGELRAALDAQAWPQAARIAHNIKGSAFYVECHAIADRAGALEHACDDLALDRVEPEWQALQADVQAWHEENAG
jgi:PAS domain S-box-containing protein